MAVSSKSVSYAIPTLPPRPMPERYEVDALASYRAALPEESSGYATALRFIFVGETGAEARDMARLTFQRYAKYDAGVDWDGRTTGAEYDSLCDHLKFFAGTPDEVETRIREWIAQLGVDEIMTQMYAAGTRRADAQRSMELFAKDVMPRFA